MPLVYSLHGGETWSTQFEKCDDLLVNITANLTIDNGEYEILNDCEEIQTNLWACECDNDYNFSIKFKTNTINHYDITFLLNFTEDDDDNGGGGGGGGGSSRSGTKVCTSYWKCTEWTNCQSNGRATRECNDLNECNATRPSEERYCYYYAPKIISVEAQEEVIEQVVVTELIEQPEPQEEQKTGLLLGWWILIIIVAIMVIMIIVFIVKSRENE